ncbi:MAG: hypothetical protein RL131_1065, partial [Bacteroidota bacterium]
MALNYIWFFFFIIAFAVAFVKWIVTGDPLIFKSITDGIFKSAGDSVDLSFKLIGIMTLFLGFMNIGEKAGAIRLLSRWVAPFFSRLFPEVPDKHPAYGHMMMNFSANLLGLDNAATPFGLKAMESLQELNPKKDTASNAQIMFLVLHASGLTLIPISIIAMRASVTPPAANPTDIFIPCMIATFAATVAALVIVSFRQKINLMQPVILGWIAAISLGIGLLIAYLKIFLDQTQIEGFSSILSNGLILLIFLAFLTGGIYKKINVFESFIEGAKGGFEIAIKIIPY